MSISSPIQMEKPKRKKMPRMSFLLVLDYKTVLQRHEGERLHRLNGWIKSDDGSDEIRGTPVHSSGGTCVLEPVYVPFLIVGSIFIAFIILGSLVAIYCCTCLRPKEPSQQPIRFSLRSYQTETLPMILTSTNLRAPSRQSSTATSSSSTGGSIRRFSFARAEPGCLVPSPPPPYTTGHPIHLTQPSGFLVSPQYFAYPLQQEPPLPGKTCPDFSSS
ncbi:protein shisa-3 homolog [Myotis lucifugus]|uniref:protein shisa-3 homolog n=1 Tax=Myotis lucifugus TaxID=59463 RepID=UPI000CCBE700|nr:protein shisa-3 homolog [Myotis lucifugus]